MMHREELLPELGCCLFVRFQDGLSGRIKFRPEELMGVLAPLREPQFFNRVFIDQGAAAWPGDIDLAPDAMYRQVASDRDRQHQAS